MLVTESTAFERVIIKPFDIERTLELLFWDPSSTSSTSATTQNIVLLYRDHAERFRDPQWIRSLVDQREGLYVIVVGPPRASSDVDADAARRATLAAGAIWRSMPLDGNPQDLLDELDREFIAAEDDLSVLPPPPDLAEGFE